MSRMIIFLSVAVVLFAAAAGASWYLQQQQLGNPNHEPDEKMVKTPLKDVTPKSDVADFKPGKARSQDPDTNRTAQIFATIQQREETIKQREQHLVTREKQLNAIHEEIKKEHAKVELVRKEVQLELNHVKQKLDQLELRTADLASEKKVILTKQEELDGMSNHVKQNEAKKFRELAIIYDKMEADPASTMLNQYVEAGKADDAASILYFMKPSQSAAVLSELSKLDPTVAAKLVDRMQHIEVLPLKK